MHERSVGDGKLPSDVYADSRNRLPLVQRDELDAHGQRLYDQAVANPQIIAGLSGPAGLRLYNPELRAVAGTANAYLRYNAGLERRLVELTILVTARETAQHFEWSAHESEARKYGLSEETIDVVRLRKPTPGLDEQEAALIELGREAIGKHHVQQTTFATALALFGPKMLLSFTALMGQYAATAILLTVFDQQLPPGSTSTLPD